MTDQPATMSRCSRPHARHLPRSWPVLPCLLALLVLALWISFANNAGGQEPETKYAQEYSQAFKGAPENGKDFSLTGVGAEKCVKFEPEGLRITLPAGYVGDRPITGLVTTFGVRGDFEITVSYEILQEPAAEDAGSGGTRLTLGVLLHATAQNLANFSRKMDVKGGPRFAAWAYTADTDKPRNKAVPAKAKTGRLRLTREANFISYSFAEGSDKEFTLLQNFPFGREDVREVRITGATGGDKAALDMRVTDLRIRAAAFPKTFEPLAPPPLLPAPPPRELAERIEVPFRDGLDKQPLMRLFGADAQAVTMATEQGMRFTLPAGRNSNNPVGVESQLRLKGDFEITVSYELLGVPAPAPPLGAGVELLVKFDTPNSGRALMSRVQKPEGALFGALYVTVGPNEKDNYNSLARRGAKESKGQLRLVRAGKKLIYQIADGAGGFLVLASKDCGTEDVIAVRVQAATGWQTKSGVDVRFTNLQMRAEQIVKSASRLLAERVEFQLREGIEKQPWLRFAGPGDAAMAKSDAEGLRFLVPAGRDDHKEVGVESPLRLRGDFEITLQYELLALPDPPPGAATGAVLQIQLDTPDLFKARMGHIRRAEGYRYGANYITTAKDGTEDFKGINVHPANDQQKRGAMRLVRTGKNLAYQISAGPAGAFLTIATKDIGTADVISTRAVCNTAWRKDLGVDIRFISLEMRADQMPDKAAPPPAPAVAASPEASSRTWLVAFLIVAVALALLLAVAVGLWLLLRQRSGAHDIPQQDRKANPPLVAFPCPECGKKLKVKAVLAGKKVKCPKCGQAVLVAAPTEDDVDDPVS